jgi:hypothetical protein
MLGEYPMTSKEIYEESISILSELLSCEFGIGYLDDSIIAMSPGDLTLVGARSGAGKTEFATQVLLEQQSQIKKKAKSVLYIALDHEKNEIEKRVLWRIIVEQVRRSNDPKFDGVYLRYAAWRKGKYRGLIDEFEKDGRTYFEHLFSLSETTFLYRKRELTARDIADIITTGEGQGYNLFIVDHFHAMLGIDTFQQQGQAIGILGEATEKANRPTLLLGQFRKRSPNNKSPIPDMDEFSGSGQITYVPQNIVTFGPRHVPNSNKVETYFHVEKSRHASDAKMFVGVHSFDMESKRYSDKYQVMRNKPFDEPSPLEAVMMPKWANNGDPVEPSYKATGGVFSQAFGKPYKEDE